MIQTPFQAEALGATLPPLLVEAERVAATVAQGVHGRRKAGTGESFWQFRPYVAGDTRIDWRRSARSAQLHVRETEWDAAQTVALWRDASPAMRWRSTTDLPEKAERAELLLLALASLLLRASERVRLLGVDAAGRTLPQLAASLAMQSPALQALPPAHGTAVLFGGFLDDLGPLTRFLGACAGLPVRGHLIQILDPAEADLPYRGRVRFVGRDDPRATLVPRVETIRDAYQARLAARQSELAKLCASAGFSFATHLTSAPPQTPLLALYQGLGGT